MFIKPDTLLFLLPLKWKSKLYGNVLVNMIIVAILAGILSFQNMVDSLTTIGIFYSYIGGLIQVGLVLLTVNLVPDLWFRLIGSKKTNNKHNWLFDVMMYSVSALVFYYNVTEFLIVFAITITVLLIAYRKRQGVIKLEDLSKSALKFTAGDTFVINKKIYKFPKNDSGCIIFYRNNVYVIGSHYEVPNLLPNDNPVYIDNEFHLEQNNENIILTAN